MKSTHLSPPPWCYSQLRLLNVAVSRTFPMLLAHYQFSSLPLQCWHHEILRNTEKAQRTIDWKIAIDLCSWNFQQVIWNFIIHVACFLGEFPLHLLMQIGLWKRILYTLSVHKNYGLDCYLSERHDRKTFRPPTIRSTLYYFTMVYFYIGPPVSLQERPIFSSVNLISLAFQAKTCTTSS